MENGKGFWKKIEGNENDASRWLPVDTPQQLVKQLLHEEQKPQILVKSPQVIQYSDTEADSIGIQLRRKESFQPALKVLTKWLERGFCDARNVNKFFNLLNIVRIFSVKLKSQKEKTEAEIKKAKATATSQRQTLLIHFNEIDNLFEIVSQKKVWDRFTNGQRKQIKRWRMHSLQIKQDYSDEIVQDRQEDEMDLSDDDLNERDNSYANQSQDLRDTITKLNAEVALLRYQLDRAQQELSELKGIPTKNEDFSCQVKCTPFLI